MRLSPTQAVLGSTLALLCIGGSQATSAHRRLHHADRRLDHLHGHPHPHAASAGIEKRKAVCSFPTDDPNLVAVTPNAKNAGWAMSPDQECVPGSYCPIACKSGMVMAQWEPNSTYIPGSSMNGGLYCDESGNIRKPFPERPNCVPGTGSVIAVNQCGSKMSWCQTVLPGNEAMIIPTAVDRSTTLAVPDVTYWNSSAAHYYVNPPGIGIEGCIWGTEDKSIGNYSPYISGANTDSIGRTFVTVGWNPVYEALSFDIGSLSYGVKIVCPESGCVGLPCEIDPTKGRGNVKSNQKGIGAGQSSFCTVTVPPGKKAHIVAFKVGSGAGGYDSGSDLPVPPSSSSSSAIPVSSSIAAAPAFSPSSSSLPPPPPPPPSSSSPAPSTTPEPSSSVELAASQPPAEPTINTTSSAPTTTYVPAPSTLSANSSTAPPRTTSHTKSYPVAVPGIFHENYTETSAGSASSTGGLVPSASSSTAIPLLPPEQQGEAPRQQGSTAIAGLVVAFIAAAYFF